MNALSFLYSAAGRVMRTRRLWLVYYCATLLFALAAALPIASLLSANLGHRLWADRMLANFDIQWIAEFAYETAGAPAAVYGPAFLLLAGGFFLFATFLAGGTIAVFASEPGRYDAGVFWGACGRNFARLLRLAVLSGLFYAGVLALYVWSRSLQERLYRDSTAEMPDLIFGWGRLAGAFLLACVVNAASDYARVRLVADDSRRTVRAFFGSFAFVFRRFRAAAGVYVLALALVLVLAASGHFIARAMPATAAGWLLVMLVVQQAVVLGRILVKLLFYAAETGIYQAFRTAPEPVFEMPEAEPAPVMASEPAFETPQPEAAPEPPVQAQE